MIKEITFDNKPNTMVDFLRVIVVNKLHKANMLPSVEILDDMFKDIGYIFEIGFKKHE